MSALHVHPLTADRWADLEKLFGGRGAIEAAPPVGNAASE